MKKNPRHLLRISIAILILVIVILIGTWWHSTSKKTVYKVSSPGKQSINYGPPTPSEQKSGDQQKQIIAKQQATNKPQSVANVVISNTSQSGDVIRVRAFVSNAVETGGTCTTTLTNGSQSVTQQTTATPDASTTQCGVINFNRSQFATAGTWEVKVDYLSTNVSGSANGSIVIE